MNRNNSLLQSLQSSTAVWNDRNYTYFRVVRAFPRSAREAAPIALLPRPGDAAAKPLTQSITPGAETPPVVPPLPKGCGFSIVRTDNGTFAYVLVKVPTRRLAARLRRLAKGTAAQLAQIWTWLRRLLVAGGVAFVGMVAGCDKFPVTAPVAGREVLVKACTASQSLCRDAEGAKGFARPFGPTISDRLLARHRA